MELGWQLRINLPVSEPMLFLNGLSGISDDILAGFAGYSGKVVAVIGDVAKSADAQRIVEEALAALGSVDVLVNNAGITVISSC